MSHVTLAPLATSDTESGPSTVAPTLRKHAPVLVTESQVAFSTAAAAPAPTTRRRWLGTTLMGGLGRILAALSRPRPLIRAVSSPIWRRGGCLGRWTGYDGAGALRVLGRPAQRPEVRSAMTRLIGRAWVPMVVVAVGHELFRGFAGFSAHTCPFRIPAPLI